MVGQEVWLVDLYRLRLRGYRERHLEDKDVLVLRTVYMGGGIIITSIAFQSAYTPRIEVLISYRDTNTYYYRKLLLITTKDI